MFEVEDFYTFEMDGKVYNEKLEDGLYVLKPSWITKNLKKFDERWLHIACFDKQPYLVNEHFKIYYADSVKILGNSQDELILFMDCDKKTYGFMNELNQIVFPAIFSNAKQFENGIATVVFGEEEFYLTRNGQLCCEREKLAAEQQTLFSETEKDELYVPRIKNGQQYLASEKEELPLPYSFHFEKFKYISSHFMIAFNNDSQYFIVKNGIPFLANDIKEDNFIRNRIIGLSHVLGGSEEGIGLTGVYVYDIFQNKIKAITNLQRNIKVRCGDKEIVDIVDDEITTEENFQLKK